MQHRRRPGAISAQGPRHVPKQIAAQLDSSIVASINKPHLFTPHIMPPRRLALVFGRAGDEKADYVASFMHHERGIKHVVVFDAETDADIKQSIQRALLYPSTGEPAIYMINNFEWCIAHEFFANLQTNILDRLPSNAALICFSNVPPVAPEYAQNAVTARFWGQFEADMLMLFDLPDFPDIAARLHWNFEALLAHCQSTPELKKAVTLALGEQDYAELAKFGSSHILADVDDFCKRVNYRVLSTAMTQGAVLIDRAFVDAALTPCGKERLLAKTDVQKEQWPFNQSVGKSHPVFLAPTK